VLRVIAVCIVSGACLTHLLRELPDLKNLVVCLVFLVVGTVTIALLLRRHASGVLFRLSFMLIAGVISMMATISWTIFLGKGRLAEVLSQSNENVVTRLCFRVMSMAQDQNEQQRFEAQVIGAAPSDIPRNILVTWQDRPEGRESVLPGQVWRAALVLKRPHGASNPSGFDFEAHMFQKNIRALGKIRGQPKLISDDAYSSMRVLVARTRHYIRQAMRQALGDARYGPVLIALAIGDQDGVSASDWDVFNRTGITHLVSISGSHVTMLAAFGGLSMLWLWKKLRIGKRYACERISARVMAACASLAVAFLYCLLAGWGVPARRTFFMLLVVGVGMMTRYCLRPTTILSAAAALVTVLDPWSPLATGFWLSFGAVCVLFAAGTQAVSMRKDATRLVRTLAVLKESARLQWLITLSMTPLLAYLFQQISLSSPLANAVAIPVVTFVVTPLAILLALMSLIPGVETLSWAIGWLANFAMHGAMYPITWLSQVQWSMLDIAKIPGWLLFLALTGVGWAMQPPGIPARWAGWCLIFPALVGRSERPEEGGWRMLALDVGQGSAIILQTRSHALLFDAGPTQGSSDAGQRVVVPVLRALGITRLDGLMVSHADLDHAGGLAHIVKTQSVQKLYASFDAPVWLAKALANKNNQQFEALSSIFSYCQRGQQWVWDRVVFTVLHPEDWSASNKKKNANSCVLHVAGSMHSALLTGDIGINEEKTLVQANQHLKAEVIVAAHHGSASSSSDLFVRHFAPRHTLIQSGYLNRFKHPDIIVLKRWQAQGSRVWRTDLQGAIEVSSERDELNVKAHREDIRRYWHH